MDTVALEWSANLAFVNGGVFGTGHVEQSWHHVHQVKVLLANDFAPPGDAFRPMRN